MKHNPLRPCELRFAGRSAILLTLALAASAAGGCGGSDDATSACEDIVDAFARMFERCGEMSFEQAHSLFSDTLNCDSIEDFDSGKVNECIETLDGLNCSLSRTTQTSCQNALE